MINPVKTEESAGVEVWRLFYFYCCPVCRSSDIEHYCHVPSRFNDGEYINYERCVQCQVVFRNPRLPDDWRLAKYEDKPLAEQQTRLIPAIQAHYAYMARQLKRMLANPVQNRLLDFGCGAGGFLLEANKTGFQVMGLELNKALAEYVKKEYKIPVFQGLIDSPSFENEKFDCIISSQVFEHLLDPQGTLESVKAHLNPKGLLLIEVPNISHIRERLRKGALMDDSHLFYFSSTSLPRMLSNAGFKVIRIEEGMRPFRLFSNGSRSLPLSLVRIWERVFSACQIKTGLSVIARLS